MKITILVVVVASLAFGGYAMLNRMLGLQDDNIAEEAVEEYIFDRTGVRVDLTPNTPE